MGKGPITPNWVRWSCRIPNILQLALRAGAGFTRCQREEGMSFTKDHVFLPQKPCYVFLTEFELKGNLGFCWWETGRNQSHQYAATRQKTMLRCWELLDHSFMSLADTRASQTTKYPEILEEWLVPENSFVGGTRVGCELEWPEGCWGIAFGDSHICSCLHLNNGNRKTFLSWKA